MLDPFAYDYVDPNANRPIVRPAVIVRENSASYVNAVVFIDGTNDRENFTAEECAARVAWKTSLNVQELGQHVPPGGLPYLRRRDPAFPAL